MSDNKIYFAAAVCATIHKIEDGDQSMTSEKDMWRDSLYQHIRTKGKITNPDLWDNVLRMASEGDTSPKVVYDYSITNGVANSSHVVAEVSRISHGVGMEIGFALAREIPVLCLYRAFSQGDALLDPDRLSRMVRGAPATLVEYRSLDEAREAIDRFFA